MQWNMDINLFYISSVISGWSSKDVLLKIYSKYVIVLLKHTSVWIAEYLIGQTYNLQHGALGTLHNICCRPSDCQIKVNNITNIHQLTQVRKDCTTFEWNMEIHMVLQHELCMLYWNYLFWISIQTIYWTITLKHTSMWIGDFVALSTLLRQQQQQKHQIA